MAGMPAVGEQRQAEVDPPRRHAQHHGDPARPLGLPVTPTRANHRSASCPRPSGRLQEPSEDLLHKLGPAPRRAVETAKGVLA
ncbi:MAG: hypothetical protein QOF77_912 [Solirubrobacteraceae bacterium]|nr:hypothetical protein [Solirubrobacteraceae bacterium]